VKRALAVLALICAARGTGHAAVWETPAQASEAWFPGQKAAAADVALSPTAQASLKALLAPHSSRSIAWTLPASVPILEFKAGWLVLVEEVGRHFPIRFAVAVDHSGAVLGVDVLEYRENYGQQIRGEAFRRQFQGKRWEDKIRSPGDIDAISGATYSCQATSRAVRKSLAVLKVRGSLP
jgi:electron transport complex protein RnfG